MVKTIASILISLALLIGATVFETGFINTQFAEVRAALEALEEKVREGSAVLDYTRAVQKL